eukprot:scaffold221251_cov32-Tisochrysis_lutea.AAC.5
MQESGTSPAGHFLDGPTDACEPFDRSPQGHHGLRKAYPAAPHPKPIRGRRKLQDAAISTGQLKPASMCSSQEDLRCEQRVLIPSPPIIDALSPRHNGTTYACNMPSCRCRIKLRLVLPCAHSLIYAPSPRIA